MKKYNVAPLTDNIQNPYEFNHFSAHSLHNVKWNAKELGKSEISLSNCRRIKRDIDLYGYATFGDFYIKEEVDDGYYIVQDTVKYIIEEASDKIIEELKRIDNIDINNAKFADYILENILDRHYSIKNDKYKSIDAILNNQAAEEIKNGELDEVINDILSDIAEDYSEAYKITAKVFFSDLDP